MIEWIFEHPWMTFVIVCLLICAVNNILCTLFSHMRECSFIKIIKKEDNDDG